MDKLIKDALSKSIREMKDSDGKTIKKLATRLGIPRPTLESYLYPRKIPPLMKIIEICNRNPYSINRMFASILGDSLLDQLYISQINNSISEIPEIKKSQLRQILTPIVRSILNSFPSFESASWGTKSHFLRRDLKITSDTMAASCGIDVDTLKVYESSSNFPSVEIFLKFCIVLNVSPEYMLCNRLDYLLDDEIVLYSLTPYQLEGLANTVKSAVALML